MDDDSGFTLIELLVVIVILGALAAVAIPTYLAQREKAHRTSAVSDMKNAATAVETFAAGTVTGSYAGADGATQADPLLDGEGFNPSQWVSLEVFADATAYCIQGQNTRLPGRLFVYRSTTGVVDVLDDSSNDCNSSLS